MPANFEMEMGNLISTLEQQLNKVNAALLMYGETSAKKLESYAKSEHPWNNKTGEAERRLHGSCQLAGTTLEIILSHGVEYGVGLELGTAPHLIVPKSAKALYWDGASHPVKKVNHPGSAPYPIIMPTIEAHGSEIIEGFKVMLGG